MRERVPTKTMTIAEAVAAAAGITMMTEIIASADAITTITEGGMVTAVATPRRPAEAGMSAAAAGATTTMIEASHVRHGTTTTIGGAAAKAVVGMAIQKAMLLPHVEVGTIRITVKVGGTATLRVTHGPLGGAGRIPITGPADGTGIPKVTPAPRSVGGMIAAIVMMTIMIAGGGANRLLWTYASVSRSRRISA